MFCLLLLSLTLKSAEMAPAPAACLCVFLGIGTDLIDEVGLIQSYRKSSNFLYTQITNCTDTGHKVCHVSQLSYYFMSISTMLKQIK